MVATSTIPERPRTAVRPKIATHLQLVSPTQARLLASQGFPGQRPLRPHHVAYLQGLIERGHFRAGTTVSFAVVGGRKYLINGQHTLTALSQTTGGPLWLQLEEIRVDSLAEAGLLYATYDRNLARNWLDLYRSDPSLHALRLPSSRLKYLSAAVNLLADGLQQRTAFAQARPYDGLLRDPQIRFALVAAWESEMLLLLAECQGPPSVRHLLLRASVLSVALITYRYQPEAAQRFWPCIAADSGLVAGDPAHTVLRFLRETPTRAMDGVIYARLVASGWNAAFTGRSLQHLRGRHARYPLLLAGTPHDGTAHLCYLTLAGDVVTNPVAQTAEDPHAPTRD